MPLGGTLSKASQEHSTSRAIRPSWAPPIKSCAPLRPDDRLVDAFSQIIDLMHEQNEQLNELQGLAADLV